MAETPTVLIRIKKTTQDKLNKLYKTKGDSYDSIIQKLLERPKKAKKET